MILQYLHLFSTTVISTIIFTWSVRTGLKERICIAAPSGLLFSSNPQKCIKTSNSEQISNLQRSILYMCRIREALFRFFTCTLTQPYLFQPEFSTTIHILLSKCCRGLDTFQLVDILEFLNWKNLLYSLCTCYVLRRLLWAELKQFSILMQKDF